MPKATKEEKIVLEWPGKPDDATIYDDFFWVRKQRWGTYVSVDHSGTEYITALTEESCVSGTRFYLKGKQEGFTNDGVTYAGEVGGKL